MDLIKLLLTDSVIFIALHIGLICLLVFSLIGEWIMKRDLCGVKRGNESWSHFALAYGILSVIVIQVISISEFAKGYKVIITIVDLSIFLYLTFFNSWFRNKTIRFVVASKTKEEYLWQERLLTIGFTGPPKSFAFGYPSRCALRRPVSQTVMR